MLGTQSPLAQAPGLEEERASTAIATESSVSYKDSENVENGASQVQKGDLRKASWREGEMSPVVKSQSKFGQVDWGWESCISLQCFFCGPGRICATRFGSHRFYGQGLNSILSIKVKSSSKLHPRV